MKKMFLTALIGIFALTLVMAANPKSPADYNGLQHPGQANQLYLYEKDSSTWEIVPDGAWGKMTFSDDKFVFNGHKLEPGQSYTLINDAEYHIGIELGTAIADEYGDVHINGETTGIIGKVWLILTSDVSSGWNPDEYLFEYNLVN